VAEIHVKRKGRGWLWILAITGSLVCVGLIILRTKIEELGKAAAAIDGSRPLLDQTQKVKAFFDGAGAALVAIPRPHTAELSLRRAIRRSVGPTSRRDGKAANWR
jgi:hypothetical protein